MLRVFVCVQVLLFGECSTTSDLHIVDGMPLIPTKFETSNLEILVKYMYGAEIGRFVP